MSRAPFSVASKPLLPPIRTLPDMFTLKSYPPPWLSCLRSTHTLGPADAFSPAMRTTLIRSIGVGDSRQASAFRYVPLTPPNVTVPLNGGSVKTSANAGSGAQPFRLLKLTDAYPTLGLNEPKKRPSKPFLPPRLKSPPSSNAGIGRLATSMLGVLLAFALEKRPSGNAYGNAVVRLASSKISGSTGKLNGSCVTFRLTLPPGPNRMSSVIDGISRLGKNGKGRHASLTARATIPPVPNSPTIDSNGSEKLPIPNRTDADTPTR